MGTLGAGVAGRADDSATREFPPGGSKGPRRPNRAALSARRGQARRRTPSGPAAAIIALVLGLSLLAFVLVQYVVGSDRVAGSPPPAVALPPVATLVVPPKRAPLAVLDPQSPEVAPPGPTGAKPLTTSPELVDLVHKRMGELRGIFGVAIKNLDSGEGVLVNADRAFPSASLFKLTVMYEAYRQREAGRLSFNEMLTITDNYARLDLGTLEVPVGTPVTVGWALDQMITRSDNATANLLADKLGWPNINNTMQELGLRETRQVGEQISTSPRDLLHLLELLALGRGPSPAASTEMVELMLDQKVNDRLPAQLPRDTPVAHKTGNLDGVVHDAGIVYSPGATYVIALLSEEASDGRQVTQAEAALSRAVYDYFNAAGGSRARSALRAPNPAARPTPVPPVVAATAGPTPPGGATPGAASPLPTAPTSAPPTSAAPISAPPPPAPTAAVVASPGRSAPPTVAPPPTAVRPTSVPESQSAAPTLAPTAAPAVTAVRPTAAPPAAPAAPPTEAARGPLPPTAAPAAPQPTAVRPTAAPPTTAPAAAPTARAPEAPRFGGPTAAPGR
jgi:beta-lactamase class A